MISDRIIIWTCGYITLGFMFCCLIDVLNIYPLMDNIAIILLIASGYIFIAINLIIRATTKKEDIKENLSKHEDEEPSEFKQI